jgi:hypothetical protein
MMPKKRLPRLKALYRKSPQENVEFQLYEDAVHALDFIRNVEKCWADPGSPMNTKSLKTDSQYDAASCGRQPIKTGP